MSVLTLIKWIKQVKIDTITEWLPVPSHVSENLLQWYNRQQQWDGICQWRCKLRQAALAAEARPPTVPGTCWLGGEDGGAVYRRGLGTKKRTLLHWQVESLDYGEKVVNILFGGPEGFPGDDRSKRWMVDRIRGGNCQICNFPFRTFYRKRRRTLIVLRRTKKNWMKKKSLFSRPRCWTHVPSGSLFMCGGAMNVLAQVAHV